MPLCCGKAAKKLSQIMDADRYEPDAYVVCEWLPRDRNVIGKGEVANRNE